MKLLWFTFPFNKKHILHLLSGEAIHNSGASSTEVFILST